MKNIILFLILLIPLTSICQSGGIRSIKTQSGRIIHSSITGNNDVLIRVDSNGNEHKLFIDNVTIYIDGDTLKSTGQQTEILTPQILSGTTIIWDVSHGKNAVLTMSGNTTITLINYLDGQSGSLSVTNASTQYTLNIIQSDYFNAISKSIGTPGNYTKLNLTGSSAFDKFSWTFDGYYMIWRGEDDFIKQ